MQDVIEEAIQRLYWACRDGRGFPGVVPNEDSGRVSTDAILRGLGLSPPSVDNARPSGSGSDSVMDTQPQLFVPRSYHLPDVQRQTPSLSRSMTTSSEIGRRGQSSSAMELDEEDDDMAGGLPDGLAKNLPDGLGPELQEGVEANIDPAMMQGESRGYATGSMYPEGEMGFGDGQQLGAHAQYMLTQPSNQFQIPSLSQQRLQSAVQSLGTSEQEVWQGRYDDTADGRLPWPGSLSSMSSKERANARGGSGVPAGRKQ
ncbi:hypothetical protein H2200_003938 [Cladophialophora chaetospira]|uniref:Uncharacterized protein n=1 Tax=Cladophialophora chaetospira TaxID=386627 RepID=A0AA38XFD7_9EURO|nr:hypothetical protein H2200_003938 [Cladophialophora chaetospira]